MSSANPFADPAPDKKDDMKDEKKAVKKLVLCFDGTGNAFSGSTADTNIVKIYDKLNRDTDDQYHYYQPGIGTYDISGGSMNKSAFGKITSKVSSALDQGFATTFDAHVIAGYRFVMRYYDAGDKIYMFGFSRGAFTARFLARMIHTVGLLSKGNEEMVPFVYQLYQRYEQGLINTDTHGHANKFDLHSPILADPDEYAQTTRNELFAFTNTFCRREPTGRLSDNGKEIYTGIKVYFLGLFDCVSSVQTLEAPYSLTSRAPVTVLGTADHVRHAVAIDERRVKFRAALLAQDMTSKAAKQEDIKEVWFPGNHGDVGGGWPAPPPPRKPGEPVEDEKSYDQYSWWEKVKLALIGSKPKGSTKNAAEDPYQMSDIPLHWMINEIKEVGKLNEDYALKWSDRCTGFERNFDDKKEQAFAAKAHDTTVIGGGASFTKTLFWKFMEILPLMVRWELDRHQKWYEARAPNLFGTRDLPRGSVFHHSVFHRLGDKIHNYNPPNNRGDKSKQALTGREVLVENPDVDTYPPSTHHTTYVLKDDKKHVEDAMSIRRKDEEEADRKRVVEAERSRYNETLKRSKMTNGVKVEN